MKKYKIVLHVEDEIKANTEEEAKNTFWGIFENSCWEVDIEEVK